VWQHCLYSMCSFVALLKFGSISLAIDYSADILVWAAHAASYNLHQTGSPVVHEDGGRL
jgi:hypothetical protein